MVDKLKSEEERQFSAWLFEALQHSLISDVKYEPKSYVLSDRASMLVKKELKTKTKIVDRFLLHPHEYTPDFEFVIHHIPLLTFFIKIDGIERVVVDTKGAFNLHGGDRNFSINRKWMFSKHGIYVNKIVPKKLFKGTWVPMSYRSTKSTKKPAAIAKGCKTIKEYLEGR